MYGAKTLVMLIPAKLCYLKVDLGIKFRVQVFQSILNNRKSFFFFPDLLGVYFLRLKKFEM